MTVLNAVSFQRRCLIMALLQSVAHTPDGSQLQAASHLPQAPPEKIGVIIQIAILHIAVHAPDPQKDGFPWQGLPRIVQEQLQVSPAMEFQHEGLILGTAAQMFSIAGPVIVYGVGSSFLYGLIIYIFKLY